MTTISTDNDVVTLMNVFTVDPARQAELVEILDRATEETMRHRPGFVSANIHVGLEGDRVANYAQWESMAAFREMLESPECQVHMRACTEIAESAPVMYRVASVHPRL